MNFCSTDNDSDGSDGERSDSNIDMLSDKIYIFSKGCFIFSCFYCTYKVDYFEVSVAIVLGGANSGQTSIKCCDLACDAESTPLKNCEDLTLN